MGNTPFWWLLYMMMGWFTSFSIFDGEEQHGYFLYISLKSSEWMSESDERDIRNNPRNLYSKLMLVSQIYETVYKSATSCCYMHLTSWILHGFDPKIAPDISGLARWRDITVISLAFPLVKQGWVAEWSAGIGWLEILQLLGKGSANKTEACRNLWFHILLLFNVVKPNLV